MLLLSALTPPVPPIVELALSAWPVPLPGTCSADADWPPPPPPPPLGSSGDAPAASCAWSAGPSSDWMALLRSSADSVSHCGRAGGQRGQGGGGRAAEVADCGGWSTAKGAAASLGHCPCGSSASGTTPRVAHLVTALGSRRGACYLDAADRRPRGPRRIGRITSATEALCLASWIPRALPWCGRLLKASRRGASPPAATGAAQSRSPTAAGPPRRRRSRRRRRRSAGPLTPVRARRRCGRRL
eukprot:111597-Chlamydomonas_euryale.AAC.1